MMYKKMLPLLLIGIVALMAAACGNQGNNGQSAPASGASQSAESSQPSSYKELYRTSVFFGDSITEGLSYHGVLNEDNVLAGAGKTAEIAMMDDDVEELIQQKPEHVYIQLGSTDILWPTDDPKEHSMKHYAGLINRIQKELPEAQITLLSVTPVTAEAEQTEPRYRNIEDYNEGLQALAAQEQVRYVDLTPLVTEHSDLYDTDGIHFQAAFYPILLDFLISVQIEQ